VAVLALRVFAPQKLAAFLKEDMGLIRNFFRESLGRVALRNEDITVRMARSELRIETAACIFEGCCSGHKEKIAPEGAVDLDAYTL
jgi:hypothetical protein